MTKKFQQKINAEKQRALEKKTVPSGSSASSGAASGMVGSNKASAIDRGTITKTRIVEKIIKESLAETKRHESLKSKPAQPEIATVATVEVKAEAEPAAKQETVQKLIAEMKEEDKKPLTIFTGDTKQQSVVAPARFGTALSSQSATKYTSVIVEKPTQSTSAKRQIETSGTSKKVDNQQRKHVETPKKFIEPVIGQKEAMKIEPQAAGSPSSTSSSSSSSFGSNSSSAHSSRSLPDMSKLDISGSSSSLASSSTLSYAAASKDSKYTPTKPNSPDIYEFKDTEPFEYEVRKSPMILHNASVITQTHARTSSPASTARKQVLQKTVSPSFAAAAAAAAEQQSHAISTPSTSTTSNLLKGRKRGSPLKEATLDKTSKQQKVEDKALTAAAPSIVAEPKLLHQTSLTTLSPSTPTTTSAATTPISSTKAGPKVSVAAASISTAVSTITATATAPNNAQQVAYLTPQKTDTVAATATLSTTSVSTFDTLRKSSNSSLNINALNEELAQTVQETTRALTDMLPKATGKLSPHSLDTTPVKDERPSTPTTPPITNISSKLGNVPTTTETALPSKMTTPPQPIVSKPVIGSPFIETRKDLSNVFELSTSDGSSASGDGKDHKFELENAKILLSATVGGAFDLVPVKFESKPTSIADKVLKAISQKKEEVENKQKECSSNKREAEKDKQEGAKDSLLQPTTTASSAIGTFTTTSSFAPAPALTTLTSSLLLTEPLKINTDLTTISPLPSLHSNSSTASKEQVPLHADKLLPKRTPLTSPESKSILESIACKNTDLNETIQKLESAIQRKTPIAGLSTSSTATTPTPSAAATMDHFSDDSSDSTDSERRLVIEDVVLGDEANDSTQKSPGTSNSSTLNETKLGGMPLCQTASISTPVKLDNMSAAQANVHGIQTPIPLKMNVTPQKAAMPHALSPVGKLTTNDSGLPSHLAGHANVKALQYATNRSLTASLQKIDDPGAATELIQNEIHNIDASSISLTNPNNNATTAQRNNENIVPIILPDIPVSVVVGTGIKVVPQTTPIGKAMQKAANLLTPNTATVQHVTTITSTASIHAQQQTTITAATRTITNQAIPTTAHPGMLSGATISGTTTSGFYLNPRTELLPEDGVKPIAIESPLTPGDGKTGAGTIGSLELVDATSLAASGLQDTQSDAINLLCEEIIPGSPPPITAADDDEPASTSTTGTPATTPNVKSQTLQSMQQQLQTAAEADLKAELGTPAATTITGNLHANPRKSSSPNDSASQDDSSEDLKKTMGIDNETSPRKRRRTRKQSEMSSLPVEQQNTKRRKQLSMSKKNTTAGSDSDDNSDAITTQRSTTTARQLLHQQQQHQQHQIMQQHQQQSFTGIRPCPYNFLVQLDSSLSSEQCIEIIQKQMHEIRKTYNMLKSDLASIDRRRKKYRRREREKKQMQQQLQQQQQQHQQQIKIS